MRRNNNPPPPHPLNEGKTFKQAFDFKQDALFVRVALALGLSMGLAGTPDTFSLFQTILLSLRNGRTV